MPIGWRRISFPQSLARAPLLRLGAHFLRKMAYASALDLGVGPLLGLLAAPGAFGAVIMLEKYSSLLSWVRGHLRDDLYVTSIPDKYLFLVVAMAVSGIVTVLKWDQILPDSQDYLNLAPLPIAPRRILLANAGAVMAAVMVVALDVSVIPAVLFPLFVVAAAGSSVAAFLKFAAVHLLCVGLASVFSIAFVFAVLGTASSVLPRAAFRACSSWLRGAILLALTALLFSAFDGPALLRHLQRVPGSPARFLPPLWYLALYQVLQHRATPLLLSLAHSAITGLAAVLALTAVAYLFSYKRRYAAVLEASNRPARQLVFRFVLVCLDAFAPRRPGLGRAGQRFVTRALLRSETHRLVIALAIGFGWMAAFQDAAGAELAMAYLLMLGLRIAFELPADVPANWIFRVILDPRRNDAPGVARRVMLSFLFPLVLVPCFAMACFQAGCARAFVNLFYVLALSATLIEFLLSGYRKLPLTCPVPGFRDNFLVLCLAQFLGFEIFTHGGAMLESWMAPQPWRLALLPAAMALAWRWNQSRLATAREEGELEEGLTFENAAAAALVRLDLTDASLISQPEDFRRAAR
jgi:hypothetical protein